MYQSPAKTRLMEVHDRSLDPGGQFPPLPPRRFVLLVVVAGVDHVLGADECRAAVDHHDLAVVAQIRPTPLTFQRLDGQHGMPLDAGLVELGEHPLVVGHRLAGGDVVEQHAHLHPTGLGFDQCLEERCRRGVPAKDEVFDVDVALGGADQVGFGLDRLLIDVEQLGRVVLHAGEPAQPPVEDHGRVEPVGPVRRRRQGGRRGQAALDHFADGQLLFAALPGDVRAADQQIDQQTEHRHQQDQQQPSHRRGGAALFRHQPEDDRIDQYDGAPDQYRGDHRGNRFLRGSANMSCGPFSGLR